MNVCRASPKIFVRDIAVDIGLLDVMICQWCAALKSFSPRLSHTVINGKAD